MTALKSLKNHIFMMTTKGNFLGILLKSDTCERFSLVRYMYNISKATVSFVSLGVLSRCLETASLSFCSRFNFYYHSCD